MVRNPNYYGPKPQLQEVDYLPYKDRMTSYNAYLAGQVDFTDIPLSEFDSAKARPDFSENNALTIFYIGMNYLVKPLENIHIRQALALALDRDVVVKAAWHNAYKPTCHIVPEGMYGYNPNLICPLGTTTKGDPNVTVQKGCRGRPSPGGVRAVPASLPHPAAEGSAKEKGTEKLDCI